MGILEKGGGVYDFNDGGKEEEEEEEEEEDVEEVAAAVAELCAVEIVLFPLIGTAGRANSSDMVDYRYIYFMHINTNQQRDELIMNERRGEERRGEERRHT